MADWNNVQNRIYDKLQAPVFKWTYSADRIHFFEPLYNDLIRLIDYPNHIIITDREVIYNQGTVLTNQQIEASGSGSI